MLANCKRAARLDRRIRRWNGLLSTALTSPEERNSNDKDGARSYAFARRDVKRKVHARITPDFHACSYVPVCRNLELCDSLLEIHS